MGFLLDSGKEAISVSVIDEFFSNHIDFAQNSLGLMSAEKKKKYREGNNKISTTSALKRKKKEILLAGGSMVFA